MATRQWTGGAYTRDWNDSKNWDSDVPKPGDDIIIPALHGATPFAPQFTAGKLSLADQLSGGPVIVMDTFTWTDGPLNANLTLTGGGTITIPPNGNFGIGGASMDIQSPVTISGGGILQVNEGASIVNNSTVTVTGGTGFQHAAGSFGTFTNNGNLIVQNGNTPSKLLGGVFTLHLVGNLTIASGSLLVGGGAYLSLEGGQIDGPGSLIVGDGNAGVMQLKQNCSVLHGATVELAVNGILEGPDDLVSLPSLLIEGILRLTGGSAQGQVHVTKAGQVSFESNPAGGISGAIMQNDGTATLQPGAALWFGGGGRLRNSGRLTINPGRIWILFGAGGFIDNIGLMEKVGVDLTTLDGIVVNNTGSVALRDGQLSLANGAVIDQTDGATFLVGGNIGGDSQVILEGGSLIGQGSIGCSLQNGGWIEPSGSGLTVGQNYTQLDTGNLVVSPSAWNGGVLPLQVTGSASLAGSIWVLAQTDQTPLDTSATLLSAAQVNGTFGRVRAPLDEQRLQLVYSPNPGSVTGKLESTPLYYGFDRSAYPADDQAIPRTGDSLMEQLYENTPLSYVGFYLAPAPNHSRDMSWMGKLALLRDQGWGVLPAYVGLQQQNEPRRNFNLIDQADIDHATQQGTDNADDACQLAGNANLEAGACIFLDIELASADPTKYTFAYIGAWVNGVQQGGFQPALYCLDSLPPLAVADQLHAAQPGVPIWVSRSWFNNALDDNGDVRPVTFDLPQGANPNQNWGFLAYAQTWQFITDWGNPLQLYDETGHRHDWNAQGLDFNVSNVYDPSGVQNGPKGSRRRVVISIELDQANVQSGQQTTAHVNLSEPAPQPDGTVVLFRSSAAEAIVTGWSRVPAGAQSVAFPIHTVPTKQQIAVILSARVLHQLDGAPVQVTLTLLPT